MQNKLTPVPEPAARAHAEAVPGPAFGRVAISPSSSGGSADAESAVERSDARVAQAVRDLEKELRAQGATRWLRRGAVLLALFVIALGFYTWRRLTAPPPLPRFVTENVERRDVFEQVQSTGTVKPLTEVQVGAQVSGRVVKVYVDFNSRVKRGDLLAEIDPSLFGAQVSQSGAQLIAAQASLRRAEAHLATVNTTLARVTSLHVEHISSKADVDQAQGEYDVAQADVGAAKAQIAQLTAQLASARTTLAYTRIYSPIDGVVINRAIEPGQTVASSFAAPVLFVIAQDLSQMQVLADIDEADVGRLSEGMKADVVVDAFPGENFEGGVTQVRYSPNTVQGVVTYSAVIEVKNQALKLRPGMTATVTVRTKSAPHVLAVRNAALRFRPLPELDAQGKPKPTKPLSVLPHGQARIYLSRGALGQEQAVERVVSIGVTDGVWTELRSPSVPENTPVITEQRDDNKKPGFRIF